MTFTPIATIGSGPVLGMSASGSFANGGSSSRHHHQHQHQHQGRHRHQPSEWSNSNDESDDTGGRLADHRSGFRVCSASPVVQCLYYWLFRLVPIIVVFLVVNCLVAFLFNHQAALTIVHVTLGVILLAAITMAIYTMVTFHYYKHFYNYPQRVTPANVYSHHRRGGSDTEASFEMLDDELGFECDQCRQERLKRTDVPPAYEAPPEYQQLDVQQLHLSSMPIVHMVQSTSSKYAQPSTSS